MSDSTRGQKTGFFFLFLLQLSPFSDHSFASSWFDIIKGKAILWLITLVIYVWAELFQPKLIVLVSTTLYTEHSGHQLIVSVALSSQFSLISCVWLILTQNPLCLAMITDADFCAPSGLQVGFLFIIGISRVKLCEQLEKEHPVFQERMKSAGTPRALLARRVFGSLRRSTSHGNVTKAKSEEAKQQHKRTIVRRIYSLCQSSASASAPCIKAWRRPLLRRNISNSIISFIKAGMLVHLKSNSNTNVSFS